MLGIKDKEAHERIDSLIDSFNKLEEKIKAFEEKFNEIKEESDVVKKFDAYVLGLGKKIENELEILEKERKKVSERTPEIVTKEISRRINDEIVRLKDDVETYNKLKNDFENLSRKILLAEKNVDKLIEVSSKISEKNFELSPLVDKIEELNNERHRLIAKIDELKDVISRERRKKHL